MTAFGSIVALLWPALLVVGLLPVHLLVATKTDGTPTVRWVGAIASILSLAAIYTVPLVRVGIGWALTIVGFATPFALSVIATRYVVVETRR